MFITVFLILFHDCSSKQTVPIVNKLKNVKDTYEKLLKLEDEVEVYLKNPLENIVPNLTICLEHYNRMLNFIIIKIKIKDRMFIRSVLRLQNQGGPTFLKYNYPFKELIENYGWTKQEIINLLIWLTDTNYLWFVFKRSLQKYKYLM